jgi:hypothetical protein
MRLKAAVGAPKPKPPAPIPKRTLSNVQRDRERIAAETELARQRNMTPEDLRREAQARRGRWYDALLSRSVDELQAALPGELKALEEEAGRRGRGEFATYEEYKKLWLRVLAAEVLCTVSDEGGVAAAELAGDRGGRRAVNDAKVSEGKRSIAYCDGVVAALDPAWDLEVKMTSAHQLSKDEVVLVHCPAVSAACEPPGPTRKRTCFLAIVMGVHVNRDLKECKATLKLPERMREALQANKRMSPLLHSPVRLASLDTLRTAERALQVRAVPFLFS